MYMKLHEQGLCGCSVIHHFIPLLFFHQLWDFGQSEMSEKNLDDDDIIIIIVV
jgi:hypothetical protein